MRRTATTILIAVLLVALFAWQSTSQPSQGFGPVYDATNQALRVNTVAGGAAGGTSSNFNQAMPGTGTAAGFRTAAGLMASASITNNNALLVEHYGNVTDTGLNAIRVNLVAGGGSGGTSSNYGTAFPTAGTAVGFKDPLGAMASASVDNTGRQIVTFATPVTLNGIVNVRTTSDSTLTATVTQSGTWTVAAGASASVANTWSTNVLTDTGLPVRPGDDTNKAVRVNVVAGSAGGTSSNFGTAFPTAGTAIGVRAGNGSMASASVTNTSALLVTLRNTDGSEVPIAQDGTFNAAVGTTGPLVGFRTAGGLQASASITNNNGLLVEHYGNVTDTANNALRVNLVAGGGTGGTSSNFGTAWPTAGTAAGFKDPLGSMASATVDNTGRQIVTFATPVTLNTSQPTLNVRTTSDSTLTATVTQSNASNLNATVAAGASASVANTWSVNVLTDAGLPVRVGDDSNKALRVNIVAGAAAGGTSSNFGTAFPTAGTAVGFQDANGAMASVSASNRLPVTCDNCSSSGGTFGTAIPSAGTALGARDSNGALASVTSTNARLDVQPASFSFVNLSKVNGDTVNVGTGAAGAGTLRVAVANDSVISSITNAVSVASSSWVNVAKINNDPVNVGIGSAAAGTQRIAVASDSQGNAGDNQAAPTRLAYIGGRGGADAQAFLRCDQFASISTANTGNWQIVASASGQNVYVCGYTFVAGVTPVAVKFVEGFSNGTFGPACSDDSADLTGAMSVAASGGVVNAVGLAPILRTSTSRALCINLSNGAQVSGHVTYTRF